MNRRNLLAALPAALAVGAVPAVASQRQTLAASLFADWLAANEAMEAVAEDDNDEFERRWQIRWDIEKRLLAAPVENALDWLMKQAAWTNFGDGTSCDRFECPDLWAEARALVAM